MRPPARDEDEVRTDRLGGSAALTINSARLAARLDRIMTGGIGAGGDVAEVSR